MRPDSLFGGRALPRLLLLWLVGCALALPILSMPLVHDDQALFRLIGRSLASGSHLYRDIWDVKQPGIFWFYWLGEAIHPTVTSGGVHWLFVLWLGATGVAAATVVALALPGSRAWMLAPFLTIPFYSLRADVFAVAQLEALVPLPILVTIACIAAAAAGRLRMGTGFFVSGLMVGVVAVFKLMLASIPAAIALVALAGLYRRLERGDFVASVLALATGTMLVCTIVMVLFAASGSLDIFMWTQFGYPTAALDNLDMASYTRLKLSILNVSTTAILLIPAALIGAGSVFNPGARQPSGRVALMLVTWLLVNLAAVLAQRMSWHAYHFAMLAWPIGVLATIGIGRALSYPRRYLGLAVLALAVLGLAVNGVRYLKRDDSVQQAIIDHHDTRALPALTASLATPGCRSAIVFGSPDRLLVNGLVPVGILTGQLAPYLLPHQWPALEQMLQQRLPAYLYLEDRYQQIIERRSTTLAKWIPAHYRLLQEDASGGRWLIRQEGLSGACPDVFTVEPRVAVAPAQWP